MKKYILILLLLVCGVSLGSNTLYEEYQFDDNGLQVVSATWVAQTFTPSTSHWVTSVKLKIYKTDASPGTVTFAIRATSSGEPTGANLTSGTMNGDTLGASPGAVVEVVVTPYVLTAGTVYAIILHNANADRIGVRLDASSPAYAGGQTYTSSDSGGTWSGQAYDCHFLEYGLASGETDVPDIGNVRNNDTLGGVTGTYAPVAVTDVESGVTYGTSGTELTGTFVVPAVGDVQLAVEYGAAAEFTGTFVSPAVGDVEAGVTYGAAAEFTGVFAVPAIGDVQTAVEYGNAAEFTGTFTSPAVGKVIKDIQWGASGTEFTGTYLQVAIENVIKDTLYGASGTEFTGTASSGGTGPRTRYN